MRLKFGELERLRENPQLYSQPRGGNFTRSDALRLAVYKYHKEGGNLALALTYFEEKYEQAAKNPKQLVEIDSWLNDLRTYDALYKAQKATYSNFKVRYRDTFVLANVELSGEIPRLDYDLSGNRQYAVWLLGRSLFTWRDQLRMPLIQACVAAKMQVSSDQVSIGVYDFDAGVYDLDCFTSQDIDRAIEEVTELVSMIQQSGQ